MFRGPLPFYSAPEITTNAGLPNLKPLALCNQYDKALSGEGAREIIFTPDRNETMGRQPSPNSMLGNVGGSVCGR
jgi:hypothetical protein